MINIGVGAHITAAAPGGKRYAKSLTSEERRSPNNCIWLCQNCAKLIDSDETAFSTERLHDWKMRREVRQSELILALPDSRSSAPRNSTAVEARQLVDYRRLPETFYQRLVGRDSELNCLDEAWSDTRVNIISLVAEGGAGKSALINEWLTRLQADDYRGAQLVLGWSFYSQGSKERASSADPFLNWAAEKLGIELKVSSTTAKADAIADALTQRRALVLLDGVEPLQHGIDTQLGQLKDFGLRAFLRRVAATPSRAGHGLVVVTSRLAVKDIATWQAGSSPVLRVTRLSDAAGGMLLRENGVWGTDKDIEGAAHDFGGHPLALSLLASYVKETQAGDVRRRDRIRNLLADPNNPGHDHARRVMESYEREWLASRPLDLAVMQMVGLFDRPAADDCLRALRASPPITGLPAAMVEVGDDEWNRSVARLREVRLLAPPDTDAPGTLDAHPLVRDWFGEQFKQTNQPAWEAAHGRLYEHLRDTTKEGETPSLEQLTPLYQAIVHGCRAGRHNEAWNEVFAARLKRVVGTRFENYTTRTLGAIGSELAALSNFFVKPYDHPVASLGSAELKQIMISVGECLSAQGRYSEVIFTMGVLDKIVEPATGWRYAGSGSIRPHIAHLRRISAVQLTLGLIAHATANAARSVELVSRSSTLAGLAVGARASFARALYMSGQREKAKTVMLDIKPSSSSYRALSNIQFDLLIDEGNTTLVHEFAVRHEESAKFQAAPLLIGHNSLILGRSHFLLAMEKVIKRRSFSDIRDHIQVTFLRLDDAVERFRSSGVLDVIAIGLLARARFRRNLGDWAGAALDLNEVEEIAEPALMRLLLCDMAIERARLDFARREAFAPLNGFISYCKSKPAQLDESERQRLQAEAAVHLASAADTIATHGYHRRDEELAELQSVIRGQRTFASLSARV
ncbi:hypothetical protein [Bradyrhizobium sp. HKCCYLS20291]|uniref:hypothetical protein n=1 Tax=Bradyrhizobium sp. HKCCYLS20291 TaxID=3420766 RepID=UPI003EBE77AB